MLSRVRRVSRLSRVGRISVLEVFVGFVELMRSVDLGESNRMELVSTL
jgi:hypothetical protein